MVAIRWSLIKTVFRRCYLTAITAAIVFGFINLCYSGDGASGYKFHSDHGNAFKMDRDSETADVTTYLFERSAVPLFKYQGYDVEYIGSDEQHIWLFSLHRSCDVVGCIDPEAFTVTLVDTHRSGENIRLRVKKWNDPNSQIYYKSATSPDAASLGSSVSDGDIIAVGVDYPDGFLYGNQGSGYVIHWALQNTGWIVG